jgi:CHAT domain-containing protein
MRIVSDGDPFPWELLCPFGLNAESDQVFLVDMVELSRWKYGSLPPATIAPHRADFVIPSQDLKEAKREFRQVSKLLKNWSGSLEGRPVKDAPALYKLFEQATVSLLHFACHNGFDKSNGQIVLKSTRVKPSDFRGLDGRLKRAPPFVFMNACRTDATPPAYIKIGKKDGWAHRFLQAGVGAFVGTLWEVRDNSAREFAAAVYSGLINNKPFGEALRCARKALRDDKPADPTWLAYSFYGSASARLKKPVPVA